MSGINPSGSGSGINPNNNTLQNWADYPAISDINANNKDITAVNEITVETLNYTSLNPPVGGSENIEQTLTTGNDAGTLGITNLGLVTVGSNQHVLYPSGDLTTLGAFVSSNSVNSTSTDSGAVVCSAGGLGVFLDATIGGSINVGGDITTLGNIDGVDITASGNIDGVDITASGNINSADITASGDITLSAGNLNMNNYIEMNSNNIAGLGTLNGGDLQAMNLIGTTTQGAGHQFNNDEPTTFISNVNGDFKIIGSNAFSAPVQPRIKLIRGVESDTNRDVILSGATGNFKVIGDVSGVETIYFSIGVPTNTTTINTDLTVNGSLTLTDPLSTYTFIQNDANSTSTSIPAPASYTDATTWSVADTLLTASGGDFNMILDELSPTIIKCSMSSSNTNEGFTRSLGVAFQFMISGAWETDNTTIPRQLQTVELKETGTVILSHYLPPVHGYEQMRLLVCGEGTTDIKYGNGSVNRSSYCLLERTYLN